MRWICPYFVEGMEEGTDCSYVSARLHHDEILPSVMHAPACQGLRVLATHVLLIHCFLQVAIAVCLTICADSCASVPGPRWNLAPDFRSLGLIRPNLRPIYHDLKAI